MIPLKIETLLEGRVVEHDRVEYKTGWNPNDIIHSICAFANDYDNTNGGYIVIGVEEEKGMPVFPLMGVPKEELDTIQQEIFQYCNQIVPRYIPKIEVVDYKKQGNFLIYLWCSAGDSGYILAVDDQNQPVFSLCGDEFQSSEDNLSTLAESVLSLSYDGNNTCIHDDTHIMRMASKTNDWTF